MKRNLLLLMGLVCLLITGCKKNEFRIEFSLSADVSESYPLIYYASNAVKGVNLEQVAVVTKGQGNLKGITRNPTLVYIFRGGSVPAAVIYAERGDLIKVSGKSSSPVEWSIEGNAVTEGLSEWRLANREAILSRDTLKINKGVGDYVAKNPENPVSTLLLLIYYNREKDPAGFLRLRNSLKGVAAEGRWSELVSTNDLLTGMVTEGRKAEEMIFHTSTGFDTVNPKRGDMLLYFNRGGNESRKKDIDELKKRIRERKDSLHPLIVTVSFESDSLTWRQQVRRDSLNGVIMAWMPLGFSDSIAEALNVTRLPAWLEIDSLGDVKRISPVTE